MKHLNLSSCFVPIIGLASLISTSSIKKGVDQPDSSLCASPNSCSNFTNWLTGKSAQYKSAELIFLQLVQQCTLVFFGNPTDTLIFRRFYEICYSSSHSHYCITLHIPIPNSNFFGQSFPRHFYQSVLPQFNNSFRSSKFTRYCLVLLQSFYQESNSLNGWKNSFESSLLLESSETGRLTPDYIFIPIPANPAEDIFNQTSPLSHIHMYHAGTKNSKIFLISEMENYRHKTFMFCHTCEYTISTTKIPPKTSQYHSPNLSYALDLSFPMYSNIQVTVKYGRALEISLGNTENFNLEYIDALWMKLHSNLGNFESKSKSENDFKSNNTICGSISQGIYSIARPSQEFAYSGHHGIVGLGTPIDPQKACLYHTILNKHNLSMIPSIFESYAMPQVPHFEESDFDRQQNQYDFFSPEHRKLFFGKIFLSEGVSLKGFHYSIFVNQRYLKQEFDLRALSRPLDEYVWGLLLVAFSSLAVVLMRLHKNVEPLSILAVALEQSIFMKRNWTGQTCMIFLLWIFLTIQLRIAYTGSNYSFLTALIPPTVPGSLEELVNEREEKKYGVFCSPAEFSELQLYVNERVKNTSKSGSSSIKFWTNLLRDLQIMTELDLQTILMNKTAQNLKPSFKSYGSHYHRFAFLSKNEISTLSTQKWDVKIGGSVSGFVSNGNAGGMGWSLEIDQEQETKWEPHLPYETSLIASGKYFRFSPNDRKTIPSKHWLFQGKKDFFMDFFQKDLGLIVQAGIYAKWEEMKNVQVENEYMTTLKTESAANFNPGRSSQRSWTMRFASITFERVNNLSLRAIWCLYSTCMAVSLLAYFKEIILLNIPRQRNYVRQF